MAYSSSTTHLSGAHLASVRERFRCPDEFLKYRLSGALSRDSGYFELSSGAVCYGRSVGAIHRAQPASYAMDSCTATDSGIEHFVLPFDPDEVLDNLLLERYPGCKLAEFDRALKRAYYQLRPLMNQRVRNYVQRLRAANGKKKQFPQWPVDTTVEDIFDALLLGILRVNRVDRIPFIWFWPDGAQGCVLMTHDVETQAGLDFSTDLMEMDDSFGIKSSFQIVPKERYAVSKKILARFSNHQHELCIHDLNHDGRLFDSLGEFRRRAALINRFAQEYGATGFRSAILYRRPEWLEHLRISFDMSMPNVAHLDPQRGGCCTVMPYFIGQVLELPLTTIQDHTLFHVLREQSIDLWSSQLGTILAKNGLATFLVHPDYVMKAETQNLYRKLLAMLSEVRSGNSIWFALPREVDSWWRERSKMSVVRDGKSWRIVGERAERARLAFAKNVDGRLVYELADAKEDRTVGGPMGHLAATERATQSQFLT